VGVMAPSSTFVALSVVLSMLLVVSEAQERFQFCGGRDLIHAVIKVCSRSLPDELAPPAERSTTTGECRSGAVLRWGRRGQLPPNLGLAPKCDMKHCLTNSKHRHIGANRSTLWLSKYAEMRFWLTTLPRPHSRLGRRHPSHIRQRQSLTSVPFAVLRSTCS